MKSANDGTDINVGKARKHGGSEEERTIWFPRRVQDLDHIPSNTLSFGIDLDPDHPGFNDSIYRERRKEIIEIAVNYRHGQPIPKVEYTPEEVATWSTIFRRMTQMYPTHACLEFNNIFPLMVEHCGYRENAIPQLQDVSDFLNSRTGFILRPVAGFLSFRDFLAGLAFRVFHATQYIRHSSKPMYTPEPDACHELLGHAPLLADASFADFAQQIGLASLGVSDECIKRLGVCFWFTFEFGLCRQDGKLRAYGGALLSSFGELEHCFSDQIEMKPYDPPKTALEEHPIKKYQHVYYVSESIEEAKQKLLDYTKTIPRNFTVSYYSSNRSIDIMNS
ncbi:protein henna-like [Daphnia carinata]|uniref:protein henna-like n=1 Tax=Daphnia carinata TaxID=120202 RepID=UPI00257FDA04|nr:protein henna-like [Daphnia carinata]